VAAFASETDWHVAQMIVIVLVTKKLFSVPTIQSFQNLGFAGVFSYIHVGFANHGVSALKFLDTDIFVKPSVFLLEYIGS